PRTRLGDDRRRLRLHRPDAVAGRVPGAAVRRAARRRPCALATPTRDPVAGRARFGAGLVRRGAERGAVGVARAGGLSLRRAAGGGDPGRALMDAGEPGIAQASHAAAHRAARRPLGQRRRDDVPLQPRPPAFPRTLRLTRRQADGPRHPVTVGARWGDGAYLSGLTGTYSLRNPKKSRRSTPPKRSRDPGHAATRSPC